MNTEYKKPVVVLLLYVAAALAAIFAMFCLIMSFGDRAPGSSVIILLCVAAALYIIGYALELLSRILHQAERIRVKLDGPVTGAPPDLGNAGDLEYFLKENNKSSGPFPLKVLLNRLRMGTLRGSAPVRLAGTKTWVELETLDTQRD
jgi:hypothetical protein